MAIRINLSANVSNIKQIRKDIEDQLKGIKLTVDAVVKQREKSTQATSKNIKEENKALKEKEKAITDLIKQYNNLDVKRKDFIKSGQDLLKEAKKENLSIQNKGKLIRELSKARKKESAEAVDSIINQHKVKKMETVDFIKNGEKILASLKRENSTLKTQTKLVNALAQAKKQTASKSKAKEVDASTKALETQIRQLLALKKQGVLSAKEFIQASKGIVNANKANADSVKGLTKLEQAYAQSLKQVQTARQTASKLKQKDRQIIKQANQELRQELRQEQAIRASLNRMKQAAVSGTKAKEISSLKTFNATAKRTIELYKAGKIEASEYLAITKQLMSQKGNMAAMDNKIAAQMQSTNKQATASMQQLESGAKKTNKVIKQQTTNVQEASKGLKGYLSNLTMITKKFFDWIAVASLVYTPFRVFQDAIQTIIAMDDALTDLNKVVELSKTQLNEMREAAIQLGKEFGITSTEIMRGMAEFGRIAKIKEDIIELTRAATLASNVTTLSADAAAKAITSTMITFGKGVEDAQGIVDSFNEIQNNFRVSAEDLANSIGKVGAAARQAGVTMEELEGYTTAIVAATGVTGNIAGTALELESELRVEVEALVA